MARGDRRTLLAEMRLEQAQANYVRKVLGDSANEIEEKLSKIGTSGNPLTRMQLEAQRSAIKAVLDQDFKDIEKSIAAGKVEAAKTASQVVSQYENQLLKAVMSKDAMRRIARSEAQRTVNNLEAALKRMKGTSYNTLSKQVYKTKQLSAGWVDDIINKGLVSGWSAQQLAKAVVPSISPNVPGGVSYAANRLARTEINNAYHAASWDRYNKSAIVDEVEWLLSSSHPEDDICNDYALESPFKKNAVPAKPHPNCYCYIVPKLPTEEEFLEKLFAGDYGDEAWMEEAAKGSAGGWVAPDVKAKNIPITKLRARLDEEMMPISSLSDAEQSALAGYTGLGARGVNLELRAGEVSVARSGAVDALDSAFEKSKMIDNIEVYRKVPRDLFPIDVDDLDGAVGKVVQDKAYLSTSARYNGYSEGSMSDIRMDITVPEGTPAIWMRPISQVKSEDEILLPRDLPLVITEVIKSKPLWDGTFNIIIKATVGAAV